MWHFPLLVENKDEQVGKEENNLVNNVYEQKTQAESETFVNAIFFSPVKPTLIKAVKTKKVAMWPGLTHKIISKLLSK